VTNSYYSTSWQVLEDDIVLGSTTTKDTYVWSQSYIDDMVARDQSVNGGAATRIYAQQDANHDVTSITDSSGNVLERFVYDPYGTATVLNASWGGTTDAYSWVYRFQGGRYDPSSGKINFRNRDLDTVTGTWMERDPIGYAQGMNPYEALGSDPAAGTDPDGLYTITYSGLTPAQQQRVRALLAKIQARASHLRDEATAIWKLLRDYNDNALQSGLCPCLFNLTGSMSKLAQVFGGMAGGLAGDRGITIDSVNLGPGKTGSTAEWDSPWDAFFVGFSIHLNTGHVPKPWSAMSDDDLMKTLFHELSHEYGTDDGESGDALLNAHFLESLASAFDFNHWIDFQFELQKAAKCLQKAGLGGLAGNMLDDIKKITG